MRGALSRHSTSSSRRTSRGIPTLTPYPYRYPLALPLSPTLALALVALALARTLTLSGKPDLHPDTRTPLALQYATGIANFTACRAPRAAPTCAMSAEDLVRTRVRARAQLQVRVSLSL